MQSGCSLFSLLRSAHQLGQLDGIVDRPLVRSLHQSAHKLGKLGGVVNGQTADEPCLRVEDLGIIGYAGAICFK